MTACTTHEAFHRIFNTAPKHELPVIPAGEPVRGDEGAKVDVGASFDGWGYVQLFNGRTLAHKGEYAVRESLDPRYASNFGDLSVHEVKTDPRGNYLGYVAYYNAGARDSEVRPGRHQGGRALHLRTWEQLLGHVPAQEGHDGSDPGTDERSGLRALRAQVHRQPVHAVAGADGTTKQESGSRKNPGPTSFWGSLELAFP